jgi:CRP-like cAMP-binding protein
MISIGNLYRIRWKIRGKPEMDHNVKRFAKGEIIFKEGALEPFLYDLIEGKVGIYARYGEAGERLLTELSAEDGGVTFGEMGLIDVMPRSATAVALEDVLAYAVTGEEFGDYFKENPAELLRIMQNMSRRIRELTQDYLGACRAVAEVVESERSGKEKTNWFRKAVNQFIEDYKAAAEEAAQSNDYYHHYYVGLKGGYGMRHGIW